MRTADRLRFDFLCLPFPERRRAVLNAAAGGSVPANYMEELGRLSRASSALQLEVDAEIERSRVCEGPRGHSILVNGESFAMVILATGVVSAPLSSPLYRSVEELLGAPMVNGLPRVDSRLRWVPEEDLFVLGASAVLELGPGGGNLMGAMRGARVVSNELHSLMCKPDRSCAAWSSTSMNQYAALGDRVRFGDGCDAEIDYLAQQLNLSPQAETALRKGRKGASKGGHQGSKATPYLKGALKGALKGQKDPIGHLTPRTRWATYW